MTVDELRKHMTEVPGEPCGKPLAECKARHHHIRYAHLKERLAEIEEDETMLNSKEDQCVP